MIKTMIMYVLSNFVGCEAIEDLEFVVPRRYISMPTPPAAVMIAPPKNRATPIPAEGNIVLTETREKNERAAGGTLKDRFMTQ